MCVQIKDLAENNFAGELSRALGACSLMDFSNSDLPQIFSLHLCAEALFRIFPPQKVHYNALFAKIRPQHAL
jgi:hypothetical protein